MPIFMLLYIMPAYLMLFACIMLFLPLIFANAFCLCASLTHSLFISSIILHHAQCFDLLVFHNSMFTPLNFFLYERAMCSLEK